MKELYTLDYEAYSQSETGFEDLKAAVEQLTSANEQQFEEIKKEKWYTRLFNCITNSKKNEKRLASQIINLNQAQTVLTEMLVRLSDRDAKVAQLVRGSYALIEKLSENDLALQSKINYLKNNIVLGIRKNDDIRILSDNSKALLNECLRRLAGIYSGEGAETSPKQKAFAGNVLDFIDTDASVENFEQAVDITPENERRAILTCCLEYIFLYNDSFDGCPERISDFVDELNIGNKTVSRIIEQIRDNYNLRGDWLTSKYASETFADTNTDDFALDVGGDRETPAGPENTDTDKRDTNKSDTNKSDTDESDADESRKFPEVAEEIADLLFNGLKEPSYYRMQSKLQSCYETENYILQYDYKHIMCYEKKTGNISRLEPKFKHKENGEAERPYDYPTAFCKGNDYHGDVIYGIKSEESGSRYSSVQNNYKRIHRISKLDIKNRTYEYITLEYGSEEFKKLGFGYGEFRLIFVDRDDLYFYNNDPSCKLYVLVKVNFTTAEAEKIMNVNPSFQRMCVIDGKIYYHESENGSGHDLLSYDPKTGETNLICPAIKKDCYKFFANGNRLYIEDDDGTYELQDLKNFVELLPAGGYNNGVHNEEFYAKVSKNGRKIYVYDFEKKKSSVINMNFDDGKTDIIGFIGQWLYYIASVKGIFAQSDSQNVYKVNLRGHLGSTKCAYSFSD